MSEPFFTDSSRSLLFNLAMAVPAPDEIARSIAILEALGYCVLKAGDTQSRDVSTQIGLREAEAIQGAGTVPGLKETIKRGLAAKLGNVLLADDLLRWEETFLGTGGLGFTLGAAVVVPDIKVGKTWPPKRR